MKTSLLSVRALSSLMDAARCPEDVFGMLVGDQNELLRLAKRRFFREFHPDVVESDAIAEADQAFSKWSELYAAAVQCVAEGNYGKRLPRTSLATPQQYIPIELSIGKTKIRLISLIGEGTFATVHEAEMKGYADRRVFFKLARNPADNDLIEREFNNLLEIHKPESGPHAAFLDVQRSYVPCPIRTAMVVGDDGKKRRANILVVPKGRSFTAETIMSRKVAVDTGLDYRHCWWIYRRLLLTLWMAHFKGIVHGAVTPDHLLVYPKEHGLVLLDWTCSARTGQKVPAFRPEWASRGMIPTEVQIGGIATPSSDIFMATHTLLYMLRTDPKQLHDRYGIPMALQNLITKNLRDDPALRSRDAETLHNEFGALLGKRTFVELDIA